MRTITQKWMIVIGLLMSSTAFAQVPGFHYGYRVGLGQSFLQVPGVSASREQGTMYLSAGLATNYQFTSMFGVNADLMVAHRGGIVHGTGVRGLALVDQFSIYSTEIPVTAKLSIPMGDRTHFRIFAGPSLNMNFSATQSRIYGGWAGNELSYNNLKYNDIEVADLSAVYGIGIEGVTAKNRIVALDFRGNQGLTRVGQIYGRNTTIAGYALTFSFLF